MNKIALITDSSCDLPQEIADQYNIFIIPLRVITSKGDYKDRIDITPEAILECLETEIPKTSSPLPEDILQVFNEVADQGYDEAICILISNKLSGTFNLINSMSKEYNRIKITCVDSLSLSMGLGCCVIEAAKAIKNQATIEKILETIKLVRNDMSVMFVVRTLEYLTAGGRIGKVAGTVGTLLNIKPVIKVDSEGSLETANKTRGLKKAVELMLNDVRKKFEDKPVNISIVHAGAMQEAEELFKRAKSYLKSKSCIIAQIGSVLAVHTGSGLLGIIAYEDK